MWVLWNVTRKVQELIGRDVLPFHRYDLHSQLCSVNIWYYPLQKVRVSMLQFYAIYNCVNIHIVQYFDL